jgi:hypothetical protein
MRPSNWLSALVALVLLITAAPIFAGQLAPVGRIKVSFGAAFIVRGSSQVPAEAGSPIFEADVLRTGADGRLGVTLKDDTRVSLGPASEVRIDKFRYAPSESNLALGLKVARGIVAYVSGRIAKLSPDAVRLETPAAIVGVRGTTLVIKVEG